MAFEKWNTSGKLTFSDGDILYGDDLSDNIDEVMPPIGAVISWLKSLAGVPATLPLGWVECNGQVLSDSDSPLNGITIPDLNASSGTARFLRGATTSGGTGGAETHSHSHTHSFSATSGAASTSNGAGGSGTAAPEPSHTHDISGTTGTNATTASSLPSYYSVVWIIRVK